MKSLARVALYTLILSLAPLSYVYADDHDAMDDAPLSLEEARSLIDSMPGADYATSGSVEEAVPQDYYDIYGRQIQFRENAKKFRAMLEARRKSFRAPQLNSLDEYRSVLNKLYEAEMVDYQNNLSKLEDEDGAMEEKDAMHKNVSVDKIKPKMSEEDMEDMASNDVESSEDEDGGLKEEPIPNDIEEDGTKKKVVTSDDAPDFDPSDL